MYDWTAKWALYKPEAIAFKEWESQRQVKWADLNSIAKKLAFYLRDHYGIQKGDRVAVLSENNLEYIYLFAASLKLGCILVPLNYRLTIPELNYIVNDSSPKLMITEGEFEGVQSKILERSAGMLHGDIKAITIEALRSPDVTMNPHQVGEEDPIFILYTSGTTGFPKGALYTYKMLFWNSINTAMSLVINQDSRTINVMPPFHTGGWNVLTTPIYHHGGMTCLMKRFDAKAVLDAIPEIRPTIFMAVPTMLKAIADEPDFTKTDLDSLMYIIVGGEPMPIPLIENYHAKGIMIRQGYGMTEVGPNLTSLHQDDAIRKKGSIGRPNFYVDMKIFNDEGEICAPNIPGELNIRGPMVTPGYWGNPEATESAIRDGWFKTGDSVYSDEEGYLFIHDRIKNMFISGAENVYPAEVERVLLKYPGIKEVIVVGVPDTKWGEVGKAFYVADNTIDDVLLKEHCQRYLAKFKIPKHWSMVKAIPKNSTGKLDRKLVRQNGIAPI